MEQGRPFSIAFIDLDRFKSINDTYGHMTGDCISNILPKSISGISQTRVPCNALQGDEFVYFEGGRARR